MILTSSPILDHGHVWIKDFTSDADLTVVNAARVSFGKESKELSDPDKGLINYLMKHRHGCYDKETEVLTDEGWKFWPDVTGKEKFITLSPSNKIEYQYAERLVVKDIDGPMIKIKSQNVDLLVTPDHNMLAQRRLHKKKEYGLIPAKELLHACHRMKMGGGNWIGKDNESKLLPRLFLLGLFIGDGHYNTSITFHLKKKRKIDALCRNAYFSKFKVNKLQNNNYSLTDIDDEFRELIKKCYNKNGEKIIPKEILELDSRSLYIFYLGLLESDGSIGKNGKENYYTTSFELVGQIQELALKIGKCATYQITKAHKSNGHFGNKPVYRLTIFKGRNLCPKLGITVKDRIKQLSIVNYKDKIYCVTVPNKTLYVRRNGKPIWCGNTPFEHVSFTFNVKCPIFVAREWFRHRIGSFNEISGRYVKLEPEFYVPAEKDVRMQIGKQGAYHYETISDYQTVLAAIENIKHAYKVAWDTYELLLAKGVAKELARTVLPVGTYTEFYWTVNARSLMNFLSLRTAPNALYEIRVYADLIEEWFKKLMPTIYTAFVNNGKIAP